jgi:hypothetical protein
MREDLLRTIIGRWFIKAGKKKSGGVHCTPPDNVATA